MKLSATIPYSAYARPKRQTGQKTMGQDKKLWDSIIINMLPIIPESVLPGADKLLPNMMISPPPSSKKTSQETLIDRARAKRLLQSLAEAGLIERDAYKKVIEHYEQKNLIPVK